MFLLVHLLPTHSDILLSANVNPKELSISRDCGQSARSMRRSVKNLQRHWSTWQLVLDVWRRHAASGLYTHLSTSSTPAAVSGPRGGVATMLGLDLVLLLIVKKITSWAISTVSTNPVFLTPFSLVFTVLAHIPHLLKKVINE